MPVFYVFTFVHCTAFYSPATEALINNNNNNNNTASLFIVFHSSRSRYTTHCTMVQCAALEATIKAAIRVWKGVVEYTHSIMF